MTEMGGGYVCWATPGSLMNEAAYPVAQEAKQPAAAPAAAEPAPRPRPRTIVQPAPAQ